jgi:hypothetical protein
MTRSIVALLVTVLAISLTGCKSKIKPIDETISVPIGNPILKVIDPPSADQKILIEVTDATEDCDVFIYLEKDREKVEDNLFGTKLPAEVIASQLKAKSISVQATIPKGQSAIVMIRNTGKSLTAKLKIKSL